MFIITPIAKIALSAAIGYGYFVLGRRMLIVAGGLRTKFAR